MSYPISLAIIFTNSPCKNQSTWGYLSNSNPTITCSELIELAVPLFFFRQNLKIHLYCKVRFQIEYSSFETKLDGQKYKAEKFIREDLSYS